MKKQFISMALLAIGIGATAQKPKSVAPKAKAKAASAVKPLKNSGDSISYSFGISLGQYLKSQGVSTVNYTLLNKAIEQSLKNQKTYLDFNAANACIGNMAQKNAQLKAGKEAVINLAEGKKFLDANKVKPGIKVTASGLQYEVLREGTGPKPTTTDTVSAHYSGALLNGTEFDNSYKRGQPLTLPVTRVIPGWTEALLMMPVGSKWKLYVPSELGYGEFGYPPDIPGGATLVFEMELLEIVHTKPQ